MEASQSLLQRYHSDRRQILSFILSSCLIRDLWSPTGATSSVSDSDLELLSANYILQCAQSAAEYETPRNSLNQVNFLAFGGMHYFIMSSFQFGIGYYS
ncbi:hypothetical protein CsSME_00038790 [Camellia sinensis var. sinensis]